MNERRISGSELSARMPDILAQIAYERAVYLIKLEPHQELHRFAGSSLVGAGEIEFALGPAQDFGALFWLYDDEYGWPRRIAWSDRTTAWDLAPRGRDHPLIYHNETILAASINLAEYRQLKAAGIVVGISWIDDQGAVIANRQYHGIVCRVTAQEGVVVARMGCGSQFNFPEEFLQPATLERYTFNESGEEVIGPAWEAVFTITVDSPLASQMRSGSKPIEPVFFAGGHKSHFGPWPLQN